MLNYERTTHVTPASYQPLCLSALPLRVKGHFVKSKMIITASEMETKSSVDILFLKLQCCFYFGDFYSAKDLLILDFRFFCKFGTTRYVEKSLYLSILLILSYSVAQFRYHTKPWVHFHGTLKEVEATLPTENPLEVRSQGSQERRPRFHLQHWRSDAGEKKPQDEFNPLLQI